MQTEHRHTERDQATEPLLKLARLLARQAAREFLASSSNMTAGTKDGTNAGVSDASADALTPTTTMEQDPRDDG